MTQTRIIITEPNGVQRTMPLTSRGLTIGRATDNNIVINYPATSRHHAQITSDGVSYYVVDLNSGNGTYLGNTRLPPNEPVAWMPGTPVQIGDVIIRQEQGQYEPQPQQPQKSGRRDRQDTETITNWAPVQGHKKSTNRWWVVLLILVGFLCVCSALGTVGYFYINS